MQLRTTALRVQRPRLVGGALIATALLGILLSFAGMVFTGRIATTAQRALARELATLDRALAATADALTIADATLSDTARTLTSLSVTVGDATRAISDTRPTISALQSLTGSGLPQSIDSTRQALTSAQEAARIADRVLGALSFLGLDYNPAVPLNVAIGQVNDSLAVVPADLATVSAGLGTADENLVELAASLAEVGEGLGAIAGNVEQTTDVVTEYQAVVSDLRGEVAAVARDAPGWIGLLRWGAFVALAWLALAQIGLLAQGAELLDRWREGAME